MSAHALEHLPLDRLRPWPRNARTHSPKQIREIAASIRRFGFTSPVLIDGENRILAGHGRVEAARELGMDTVPCVRIDGMTAAEKRAYVIADNRLALNAGWDEELLALEFKELMEANVDFDLGITGFSIPEIDALVEGLGAEEAADPAQDELPYSGAVPSRCRSGDVWRLGPHRLICGDALNSDVVAALMDGEKAEMIFTDPPSNGAIEGDTIEDGVSAPSQIRDRELAMATGELIRDAFTEFLRAAFANLVAYSRDGSIHFVSMDWRRMGETIAAGDANYSELKDLIVWVKDNGGSGEFYRPRHELIFAFKNGSAPEPGQPGCSRTNVWEYRGVKVLKPGRTDGPALRPAAKSVAMIADAIKDVSHRGGIVLDLFGGSGSTLIAAHKTGRRARICELDPVSCDRILRRWEIFSRDEAELVACGSAPGAKDDLARDRRRSGEPPFDKSLRARAHRVKAASPSSPRKAQTIGAAGSSRATSRRRLRAAEE